jgi:hypothetical protein
MIDGTLELYYKRFYPTRKIDPKHRVQIPRGFWEDIWPQKPATRINEVVCETPQSDDYALKKKSAGPMEVRLACDFAKT